MERGAGHRKDAEPPELSEKGSIIVIADTHLGLHPNRITRPRPDEQTRDADPAAVHDFLAWLMRLPTTVGAWDEATGKVDQVELRKPEFVVLLGDIFELWDGPEESLYFSMATTFSLLKDIGCKVVYLLGNHDGLLGADAGGALSRWDNLSVLEGTWPSIKGRGESMTPASQVTTIKAGTKKYLFLHGHQFDKNFQDHKEAAGLPPHLRRAARLGLYQWSFAAALAALVVLTLVSGAALDATWVIMVVVLTLFTIPTVYLSFGRRLWEWRYNVRFSTLGATCGFLRWWASQTGQAAGDRMRLGGLKDLVVVFGHTHILNVIGGDVEPSGSVDRYLRWRVSPAPLLLNVPSWIKHPVEGPDRATFLYIDTARHGFFKLDGAGKPYHVPDVIIRKHQLLWATSASGDSPGAPFELPSALGWPEDFRALMAQPPKYYRDDLLSRLLESKMATLLKEWEDANPRS